MCYKYVLDADIAKCFDRINHSNLLAKINTSPSIRRQIKAWLKVDIVDFKQHTREPGIQGVPQGGIISPLLSNIALHGLENRLKQFARTLKGNKRDNERALSLIRYADDLVVIHENLDVIKKCQQIISEWLAQFDLELKPSKTRIVHTLKEYEGNKSGFTFLDGDLIETDHITPKAIGGNQKDNLQLLHRHCHDIKTRQDLRDIKTHKSHKEWKETLKQFTKMNWIWIDDILTLVEGTHTEPLKREAM